MDLNETVLEKMMVDAVECNRRAKQRDGHQGWAPPKLGKSELVAARRENILRGFSDGMTVAQLAKRYRVTEAVVRVDLTYARRNCVENGIEIPERTLPTNRKNQALIKLIKVGATHAEIARALNVTTGTVSRRVRKLRERGVDV